MTLPEVSVTFACGNPALQRLWDEAERRAKGNLRRFGDDLVLVEGGGYEKIWLETQPMGGEMYAARSMEAAVNNSLLFMRHQRADGRLPGSIQCVEGQVEPQFNKLQGFCFAHPALNLYYLLGRVKLWLERLEDCLRRFGDDLVLVEGGGYGQIFLAARQERQPGDGPNAAGDTGGEADLIAKGHRLHDHFHFMVAVRPGAQDVQGQVDLGRGEKDGRTHLIFRASM